MENNLQPSVPQQSPQAQNPQQQNTSSKSSFTIFVLLAAIILILLAVVGSYVILILHKGAAPKNEVTQRLPSPTVNPASEWLTYTSQKEGLSFHYPKNWTAIKMGCVNATTQQPGECMVLRSPQVKNNQNGVPQFIQMNFMWNAVPQIYNNFGEVLAVQPLIAPHSKKPLYLMVIKEPTTDPNAQSTDIKYGITDHIAKAGAKSFSLYTTSQKDNVNAIDMEAVLTEEGSGGMEPYSFDDLKKFAYYQDMVKIFTSLTY